MSTPTEWDAVVSRTYADVVGEADAGDGIARKDAFDIAGPRLEGMVRRGEIEVDLSQVIRQSLSRADESNGKKADRLIAETRAGNLTLFDAESDLSTVVVLGGGLRKLWRHVNDDDLDAMNNARFQNLRSAQASYREWREHFEVVFPAVKHHGTVERAIAAGAFLDQAESAA